MLGGQVRDLGYVEADEALDLDGVDAAHKAVILAYLAHGIWVNLNEATVERIRRISNEDLKAAANLIDLPLIGVIRREFSNDHVAVAVHPALIPIEETIVRTDGVHNGVCLNGSWLWERLYRLVGERGKTYRKFGDFRPSRCG